MGRSFILLEGDLEAEVVVTDYISTSYEFGTINVSAKRYSAVTVDLLVKTQSHSKVRSFFWCLHNRPLSVYSGVTIDLPVGTNSGGSSLGWAVYIEREPSSERNCLSDALPPRVTSEYGIILLLSIIVSKIN